MADSKAPATIVLVARNDADLVGGAVASLLAQQGGSYPIQVIDDGSTDATWDRIQDVIKTVGSHEHDLKTVRCSESQGPRRLIEAIEKLDTPYVIIASTEDRSRPKRVERLLGVIESTGAAVIATNRTRLGGSVIEHAGNSFREGSGPIDAREIAFHLGCTPTTLGTLAIRTDVLHAFPSLAGPRLSEDLGPLFGFRGSIIDTCYYLDETLVDFRPIRESASLDVRSRETCREGLFANLIASRTGMLHDLRDLRREQTSEQQEATLVHLEASLKGVLIELVERWTQAREELWSRDMRPCWVTQHDLNESNHRVERLRPRSFIGRMKQVITRQRPAA
jgi:hypothetical protein